MSAKDNSSGLIRGVGLALQCLHVVISVIVLPVALVAGVVGLIGGGIGAVVGIAMRKELRP